MWEETHVFCGYTEQEENSTTWFLLRRFVSYTDDDTPSLSLGLEGSGAFFVYLTGWQVFKSTTEYVMKPRGEKKET